MKKPGNAPIHATRTSKGLRDSMFDVLDDLRNGKTTPQAAAAAARLGMVVISAARMDIEHQRYVNHNPSAEISSLPILQLGSN